VNKDATIRAFVSLGNKLDTRLPEIKAVMEQAYLKNNWFTETNVTLCLKNWQSCLTEDALTSWLNEVPSRNASPKEVGIIMAGNVPLVGFHDLLCVLATGNKAKIKLSQNDEVLMKYCVALLIEAEPGLENFIQIAERVIKPDALIATGSNNSSRYFEYYFRDIPCIIRKNRTSVAVLDGSESKEKMELLADDIFQYFGLGCRNVTKLLVPRDYDLIPLLDATQKYSDVGNHHKYANNNTYHRAIFLMNLTKHLDTGYLLVKEDEKLHTPLSCIFYQRFDSDNEVNNWLSDHIDEIQVVVSDQSEPNHIPFGTTQHTKLSDYADGVNTLNFLNNL
jgi:hypothetical protein